MVMRIVQLKTRCVLSFVILGSLIGGPGLLSEQGKATNTEKRPVTVADVISMTRVAGSVYPAVRQKSGFAVFSSDGERFAIILCKGNIEKNTNDYSLLVFRTADLLQGGSPKTLAFFSTSSNRAGIFDVRWSDDNEALFFLGARGEDATQLYSVQHGSGQLRKLTNHLTSVTSYGFSERLGMVVY